MERRSHSLYSPRRLPTIHRRQSAKAGESIILCFWLFLLFSALYVVCELFLNFVSPFLSDCIVTSNECRQNNQSFTFSLTYIISKPPKFRKIRKGQYEFHEEYWGTVSDDAKDLISNLLVVDCEKRLTAREALQTNWIALSTDDELQKMDMGVNLVQMRKFNGKRKFRAAVASVVAVNKLTNFLAFDTFQPGCLPKW